MKTIIQLPVEDGAQLLDLWAVLPDAPYQTELTEDGDILITFQLAAGNDTTVTSEADTTVAVAALGTSWSPDKLTLSETTPDNPEPEPEPEVVDEPAPAPQPTAPTMPAAKPGRARRTGPTCGQAIVAFLDQEPEIVFTTEQITEALTPAFKASTVKFTLSEITRAGDITRVRPGLFQAKQAA